MTETPEFIPLQPHGTLPSTPATDPDQPGFLDEARHVPRLVRDDDDARHVPRNGPEQHRASRAYAAVKPRS